MPIVVDPPRKLSAILMADAVDYSLLMGADEVHALTILKKHTQTFVMPAIYAHLGRIINVMGDGILAEFPSVVKATACAYEIQLGMADRNQNIAASETIQFRIGINIGDVIVEGDDIHGDGVNITARLEALAEPGGICISGIVFDALGNKLPLKYKFMGKKTVKNIVEPLRVYRIHINPGSTFTKLHSQRKTERKKRIFPIVSSLMALILVVSTLYFVEIRTILSNVNQKNLAVYSEEKPTIAILPFTNVSDGPMQKYISNGMLEDIASDLSQFSGLTVKPLNLPYIAKETPLVARPYGEDLDAQYVLEGSANMNDQRVHISVRLVETRSGHPLWEEHYDRKPKDLIAVKDDISLQIVKTLSVQLTGNEASNLIRNKDGDFEAYN